MRQQAYNNTTSRYTTKYGLKGCVSIGVAVVFLTVSIQSVSSFCIGRPAATHHYPQLQQFTSTSTIPLQMAVDIPASEAATSSTSRKEALDEEEDEESSTAAEIGKWEYLHGNFILRPNIEDGPPRALIHFLGGALAGVSFEITFSRS